MPLRPIAEPALEVDAVSVDLAGCRVLDAVSLTAQHGRILGVLGENGAGKSTLMQLLSGALTPSMGAVTVLGQRLPWRDRRLLAQLGYVPQETALYDELTVREQLQLFATVYALEHPQAAIARVVALLALTLVIDQRAGRLSGGMRRRVVIARALMHEPALLLIDEPTLAVDAETRHLVWSHLRQLRSQGAAVVIATNYLEEARAVCDDVVVLRRGRVVLAETLQALLSRVGMVVEIDADEHRIAACRSRLAGVAGVLGMEATHSGLVVRLAGPTSDPLAPLLGTLPAGSWRSRGPDLHEILHAISPGP